MNRPAARRISRRDFLAMSASTGAAAALAACGFGSSPSATTSPAVGASVREQMIAKARQEGEVVLTGGDAMVMANAMQGFSQLYPFITVKPLNASPTDIVTRVTAEAQAGRLTVDVLEIEEGTSETLARAGLLEKQDFPHVVDWRPGGAPTHGMYVTLGLNPFFQVVYNTNLVKASDVPKTFDDIADAKWTGKSMMSRTNGAMVARLASLWGSNGQLDWARAEAFLAKIAQQQPKLGNNFTVATDAVARGEIATLWMGAGNPVALAGVKGEAPISALAFNPMFAGYVTLVVPKQVPHPAAAWLLVDYLTSPEGQFVVSDQMLAVQTFNHKAKAGRIGAWAADHGATAANMKIGTPDQLADLLSAEVLKRSNDTYRRLLGIQ